MIHPRSSLTYLPKNGNSFLSSSAFGREPYHKQSILNQHADIAMVGVVVPRTMGDHNVSLL